MLKTMLIKPAEKVFFIVMHGIDLQVVKSDNLFFASFLFLE